MKLRNIILLLSTALGAGACASVSAPEGGPKDETPPTLLSSNPKDQELNVGTKTITLSFDEQIQQNNLNNQLLITPNTQNKYKVSTDKNKLSLEFEKALQENTTYTFNFREGITDITEKNKAQNIRLSFSTGSFIDSSKVSGTVVNLLTQKPEPKAIVALYPTNDTLSIRKNRPYYQTDTDASGKFELKNIREGEYRIYALVEKNNNNYYDSEEERIAYLADPITLTPNTEPVELQLTKFDTKKPIMLKRESFTDRFIANYNEGVKSFTAKATGVVSDSILFKIGAEGRAIEVFKTEKYTGGKTVFSAVDTAGNIATDTIDVRFEGKRAQRVKGASLKVINTATSTKYAVGSPVRVELETPVRIVGKEPISIMEDSVVLRKLTYPGEVTLDPTRTELSFIMPNIKGRNNQISLVLDSTAIQPIEGNALSFTRIPVTLEETGGTGSIIGKTETKYNSYTIQLLTPEYKVIREIEDQKNYQFRNLTPGNYIIRVLVDENNNNEWDRGTVEFDKAPEKVYIYPKPIEVRANWELEGINLEF